MLASAAPVVRAASKPDPEGSIAIFRTMPSVRVIENFREWLLHSGRPDTWPSHARSRPRATDTFEVLLNFDVPHSLRSAVGMATCPICSPEHPQYFKGVLVWFPREAKIRAIGRDCAATHFGYEVVAAATERHRHRIEEESAFDFVGRFLGVAEAWRQCCEALQDVARHADELRTSLWRAGSKTAWKKVVESGLAMSRLIVSDHRSVTRIRADGTEYMARESIAVFERRVQGLGFMVAQPSIEGDVKSSLRQIERHLNRSQSDLLGDLVATAAAIREAERWRVDAYRRLVEAQSFTRPENLSALSEWSHHFLNDTQLRFSFSLLNPGVVRVGHGVWQSLRYVDLPKALLVPLPYLPDLEL
jgi:hypothetical protein